MNTLIVYKILESLRPSITTKYWLFFIAMPPFLAFCLYLYRETTFSYVNARWRGELYQFISWVWQSMAIVSIAFIIWNMVMLFYNPCWYEPWIKEKPCTQVWMKWYHLRICIGYVVYMISAFLIQALPYVYWWTDNYNPQCYHRLGPQPLTFWNYDYADTGERVYPYLHEIGTFVPSEHLRSERKKYAAKLRAESDRMREFDRKVAERKKRERKEKEAERKRKEAEWRQQQKK